MQGLKWLGLQRFEHKFLVGGNHDFILEQLGPEKASKLCAAFGVRYLHSQQAPLEVKVSRVNAKLRVWGSGASCVAKLGDGRAALSGNNAFQIQIDNEVGLANGVGTKEEQLKAIDFQTVYCMR